VSVARPHHEILTRAEVDRLVARAPCVLGLIIECLAQTGLRISELLQIQLTDLKPSTDCYRVEVTGKHAKRRRVMIATGLVDRVRFACQGSKWLFEHHRRPYNRASVTTRIGELAERVHASVATTADLYCHSELCWTDIGRLLA
jgi:integrase